MTERERGDSTRGPDLDRRTYLTGLAAASIPAVAGMNATAQEDYEVIEVGPGERFTKHLDDGETWENVLIDITADGADYLIRAIGNDWTIRNIGIRGTWPISGKISPLAVAVTDPNSEGHIENVYLGDRQTTARPYGMEGSSAGVTGLFVPTNHAGTLYVDNVNIQSYSDNCIYASAPGNPSDHPSPGAGGPVIIRDSYARHTNGACFRIGTDGSRVENCVAVGGSGDDVRGSRAFWGYYQSTEIVDCDFSGSTLADVVVGASAWDAPAEVTVENCRFDTSTTSGVASLNGSSAGEPRRTEPEEVEGVPLTPEEAASGASSGGSNSGGGSIVDDEDETDEETEEEETDDETEADDEHVLLFDGTGQGSDWELTDYYLEVEGELTPSEHEDAVIDPELGLEDGASSVEHAVANWKDAFTFEGDLLTLEVDGPATVYLDGEEIDPDDFDGADEQEESDGDDSDDDSSGESDEKDADERSSWIDQWCRGDWRLVRLR